MRCAGREPGVTKEHAIAQQRNASSVRLIPLGGVGEIGKNMAVLEVGDQIIIIDCGMTFPRQEQPGVDLVVPDFTYVKERRDRIAAVILTHGHEDHIGALPYLIREVGHVPVYGTRFTLGLVRGKLDEHRLTGGSDLNEVKPGERVTIGPIEAEFLRVTHSIPDCVLVALRTPVGLIVHTGDFRFDHAPIDGLQSDLDGLSRLGDEGVLLLLADSTNAEVPGTIAPERSVGPELRRIMATAPGRVIITTFSSHIHRVQQVLDAAHHDGRVVALVGRSMLRNTSVATNLGFLSNPPGVLVSPKEIESHPADEQVVLCTGSQGEPLSALRRMAHGDHAQITIGTSDTVVFSARTVPGNELARNETVNRLVRAGARISDSLSVHVSGHGAADELRLMLRLLRPTFLAPVHGEARHQRAHADLALGVGIAAERIVILDNGDVLDVTPSSATIVDRVEAGISFVEGLRVGDVSEGVLRDRRRLSEDGLVVIIATINSRDGQPVGAAEIVTRGIGTGNEELLEELRVDIATALADAALDPDTELDVLRQRLHDAAATLLYRRTRQRPMVLPVVVPV
ncbi:MAG: ribonuclease J [Actinobacteria bacterium]|nr:ribonuclease J [Actinomycetota bacterium]